MTAIQTVSFYDYELTVAERDGFSFVAMRPLVDAMGLNWAGQFKRLQRDPAFNNSVVVMTTGTNDGPRDTLFLKLELLPGWLATISTNRINKIVGA